VQINFLFKNYFNFFLFLFPIFYYLGPIGAEISLLFLVVFYSLESKNYNKKYYFEFQDFIIIFFFIFIIFTSLLHYEQSSLEKSIFILRFIILYYIVNKTKINKNIYNFFLISVLIVFFVSTDVIYQIIFGKDILGNFVIDNRPHLFFRETEQVTGSVISRFLFFVIIYFIYKKFFLFSLCLSFFLIFVIFLSGERANLLTSIFFLIILIIFVLKKNITNKNIKYSVILACVFLFLIFKIFTPENKIKRLMSSKDIIQQYLNKDITNPWFSHLVLSKDLITKNAFIGNGINSFRIICNRDNLHGCSTHPHNIYLEILVETGILGLIFFLIFNFITIINSFKVLMKIKLYNYIFFLYLAFFFQFLAYLFPFRPTGSFFNNLNLYYYFFIIAVLNNNYFNKAK
jgi:O-antigen ligase